MVLRFRCAAARPACLPPCHRMAACPTGTAPSPSPLPYPESQIARRQRSDRGGHNCMRAVHAGVTDYRLNAPEIAIGRPLLVENRPCEVCAAWSPLWKKKKSYLRRLVVHACCVPCASQGYHGDPHALENPWVCCLCAGCQKPKTPYSPLDLAAHVQRKSLAQNHDASRMCAQVSEPIVHAARRSLRFRSPLPSFLRPSLLVTHTPDAHTVFDPPDGPLPFLPPPRSRKSFSAAWKPLR